LLPRPQRQGSSFVKAKGARAASRRGNSTCSPFALIASHAQGHTFEALVLYCSVSTEFITMHIPPRVFDTCVALLCHLWAQNSSQCISHLMSLTCSCVIKFAHHPHVMLVICAPRSCRCSQNLTKSISTFISRCHKLYKVRYGVCGFAFTHFMHSRFLLMHEGELSIHVVVERPCLVTRSRGHNHHVTAVQFDGNLTTCVKSKETCVTASSVPVPDKGGNFQI
jgi:hypothetical protein